MRRFILLLFLIFSFQGMSQIVIGEAEPTNEPKVIDKKIDTLVKLKKSTIESDGVTSVYAIGNWSTTSRFLTENEGLFGDTLGKRADESALNVWSFGIGLRNKINNYLFWDGGIAIYRNGERYRFEGVDTMFAYQTYYNYISMPLRLNAVVGKDFKWNAGIGLVPQMFTGYRQEQQWETTTFSKGNETIKTKSGYNSFVLSAVFNVGLTIEFKSNWAFMVSPEARIHLTSSYNDIAEYIHKGRAFGVSFGLIRNL